MKNRKRINSRSRQAGQIKIIEKKKECRVLERDAGTKENIQRVSEISTLILTGDRRTTKLLCTIFSKSNFHFSILPPHKLTSCLFSSYLTQ
jgi:hypothetical protein